MDDDTPEVKMVNVYEMCRDLLRTGPIGTRLHARPFVSFVEALRAALPPEAAERVREAADRAYTWPTGCQDAAEIAVKCGVPVASINFLAALHLKE